MLTIWERYFIRTWLKIFALFLICFYGLYIIIDYASHTGTFHNHQLKLSWTALGLFYVAEFFKKMDLLLPLGIVIATVRTLCQMNVHRELVALLASGISLKRLMMPFIWLGLAATCLIYINYQYSLPYVMHSLKPVESLKRAEQGISQKYPHTRQLALEDGTILLFNRYDSAREEFEDVYWIRSFEDIYHSAYLNPHLDPPQGTSVDFLHRQSNDQLLVQESFPSLSFPEMQFNPKGLLQTISLPDEEAFLDLIEPVHLKAQALSEKDAKRATLFYRKLVLPWLCLLAVIGPIPFCVQFTRTLPVFFIYAGSVFALVASYLVMNAAKVMGERQVADPFWATIIPFGLLVLLVTISFVRPNR